MRSGASHANCTINVNLLIDFDDSRSHSQHQSRMAIDIQNGFLDRAKYSGQCTQHGMDQPIIPVSFVFAAKEFTGAQLPCRSHITHNHFSAGEPRTAKWQHVHCARERLCWFQRTASETPIRMIFFFLFHPFARSRRFLYALTVAKLHILQHCLIKCMSCRICNACRVVPKVFALSFIFRSNCVDCKDFSHSQCRPHVLHVAWNIFRSREMPLQAIGAECDDVGDCVDKDSLLVWHIVRVVKIAVEAFASC